MISVAQDIMMGGISIGSGYNSEFITLYKRRPEKLSFGMDMSLMNYNEKSMKSSSYYGALYTQNHMYAKDDFNADLILGVSYAKSDYQAFSTEWTLAPNIGFAGVYAIDARWAVVGKFIAMIYSDGAAIPYNVGVEYKLKAVNVTIGVQGLYSLLSNSGSTTSSNVFGWGIILR